MPKSSITVYRIDGGYSVGVEISSIPTEEQAQAFADLLMKTIQTHFSGFKIEFEGKPN